MFVHINKNSMTNLDFLIEGQLFSITTLTPIICWDMFYEVPGTGLFLSISVEIALVYFGTQALYLFDSSIMNKILLLCIQYGFISFFTNILSQCTGSNTILP